MNRLQHMIGLVAANLNEVATAPDMTYQCAIGSEDEESKPNQVTLYIAFIHKDHAPENEGGNFKPLLEYSERYAIVLLYPEENTTQIGYVDRTTSRPDDTMGEFKATLAYRDDEVPAMRNHIAHWLVNNVPPMPRDTYVPQAGAYKLH